MLSWIRNKCLIRRLIVVKLLFALGILILYPLQADAKRVRVRGYIRQDGTYVASHYCTAPDGNPYNNYSYPGNYTLTRVK